ncbi:MAG TPA: hypothetical protein VHX37_13840 [Acidobacteriaceae bacterium]|jgi:hypothetical protein|nr:hypothetical protein [Acidobacteriaceae bacterium]
MRSKTLDTRFVWGKPEAKAKSKGQWESERELGFEWGTKRGGDLQLRWTSEKKGRAVWYRPPTGLFRDFAGLRVKKAEAEEEILRFANEYGDILSVPGDEFFQQGSDGGRHVVRRYGTLSMWRFQVEQMRYAVEQWDICNDDGAKGRARRQAREQLQIEIESALSLDLILKVLNTEVPLRRVSPGWARVRLNKKLELFVEPVNLLAFMWLTLARLASGEIAEQPCMGSCGRYIYTGQGVGLKKTGTVTCGPACRKWKERNSA